MHNFVGLDSIYITCISKLKNFQSQSLMLTSSNSSDGKSIMHCFSLREIEIHPIVAIYGLLWYLNSIYGIILMIIEYQNVCFYQWFPVCIVNATVPILWLLIITMVDSCCIKYHSLKKWHRRHYGAAFLYFAIFTNQLFIFGTLCCYGFVVWNKAITTSSCQASYHLYYGFILLVITSTILITWIGFYQFYAATKYLCTYHAVLDVKRRQEHSNNHSNHKNGHTYKHNKFKKNGRKFSVDSQSKNSVPNTSTMSLTFIGSIFRYGEGDNNDNDYDSIEDNNDSIEDLQISDINDINNINNKTIESIEPFKISDLSTPDIDQLITPLPSLRKLTSDIETEELMECYNNSDVLTLINNEEEKDISIEHSNSNSNSITRTKSDSISESSPSPSAFTIEIAGITIPTRKFTKTHSKHKYKSVNTNTNKHNHGEICMDEKKENIINEICINENIEEKCIINNQENNNKNGLSLSMPFCSKTV
eukprot:173026_1